MNMQEFLGIESMAQVGRHPFGIDSTMISEDVSPQEVLTAAGLDWKVERRPLMAKLHGGMAAPMIDVPDNFAIVRDIDNAVLGVVGKKYRPVQNVDTVGFMEALHQESEGGVKYDVAGALKGGRVVFVLARLPGYVEHVGDDVSAKYVMVSNTHDGSGAFRAMITPIRVVCMNTYLYAMRKGRKSRTSVSIRHTSNVMSYVEDAKKALGFAQEAYNMYEELSKQLVNYQMSVRNWNDFVNGLLEVKDPQKIHKRTQNTIDALTEEFESGMGTDIPGVRGTAWAALNAVTSYNNYRRNVRGGEQSSRLYSSWFGSGANTAERATNMLLQYAA